MGKNTRKNLWRAKKIVECSLVAIIIMIILLLFIFVVAWHSYTTDKRERESWSIEFFGFFKSRDYGYFSLDKN